MVSRKQQRRLGETNVAIVTLNEFIEPMSRLHHWLLLMPGDFPLPT